MQGALSLLSKQGSSHIPGAGELPRNLLGGQLLTHPDQSEVRFNPEFASSLDLDETAVSALRRIVKGREALSEARPFSVALLGFGSFYIYRDKWLWYIHNKDIRGLRLDSAAKAETGSPRKTEFVINYPKLLEATAVAHQGFQEDSFSLLHFQDGILSCLYRLPAQEHSGQTASESESEESDYEERDPVQSGWLIFVDVSSRSVVYHKFLDSTKNIFVRTAKYTSTGAQQFAHTYLYYGHRELDHFEKRHRWTLEGFNLTDKTSLGNFHYLQDTDGFELGSTVCFEIINGFFYAVTNQSTYRAQEIDWSSFYHCIRFPINDPCRKKLEKSEERSMWRRQHSEGPLDDRWSTMSIAREEKTGALIIVECRKELATGKRTAYTTNVVFPGPQLEAETTLNPVADVVSSKQRTTFKCVGCTPQEEEARRLELLSLTQDRVALTIEDHHTPRFLAPQTRLATNVHAQPADGTFTFSATPARSYNASASCFLDLVNDLPRHDPTVKQCLRLRACTRRPTLPPKDDSGIIQFTDDDALNYVYGDSPIGFWPPQLPSPGLQDNAVRQLHELLNPPGHQGKVIGTFDDTSLVYSVGKEGTQKALIFVNFDASLRLPGLQRWEEVSKDGSQTNVSVAANSQLSKGKRVLDDMQPDFNTSLNLSCDESDTKNDLFPQRKKHRSLAIVNSLRGSAAANGNVVGLTISGDERGALFRTEPASYLSIGQGFDFSAWKSCF